MKLNNSSLNVIQFEMYEGKRGTICDYTRSTNQPRPACFQLGDGHCVLHSTTQAFSLLVTYRGKKNIRSLSYALRVSRVNSIF